MYTKTIFLYNVRGKKGQNSYSGIILQFVKGIFLKDRQFELIGNQPNHSVGLFSMKFIYLKFLLIVIVVFLFITIEFAES